MSATCGSFLATVMKSSTSSVLRSHSVLPSKENCSSGRSCASASAHIMLPLLSTGPPRLPVREGDAVRGGAAGASSTATGVGATSGAAGVGASSTTTGTTSSTATATASGSTASGSGLGSAAGGVGGFGVGAGSGEVAAFCFDFFTSATALPRGFFFGEAATAAFVLGVPLTEGAGERAGFGVLSVFFGGVGVPGTMRSLDPWRLTEGFGSRENPVSFPKGVRGPLASSSCLSLLSARDMGARWLPITLASSSSE
mmetsp:Transcript_14716/g.34408  ORF Transcript_14716/g.34408 Transcript_14716/m.34408 type:complete len:255 (+) Transcript_14716:561-1325(+)